MQTVESKPHLWPNLRTAVLELTVTVNMVLDGRTATLTVTDTVPLASVLICGDTPSAYASNFD